VRKVRHDSDYYLKDEETGRHYLTELKIGSGDNEPTYVNGAGQRFRNVCGMKVVPIMRGEEQPFLLTPSSLKVKKSQERFSISA
jgi:hypothetical protein